MSDSKALMSKGISMPSSAHKELIATPHTRTMEKSLLFMN
jgi:hypothetical protein